MSTVFGSFPPIFVINLEKDIQKKIHMQELCKKFDLQAEYEKAIYGADLSGEEILKIIDKEKTLAVLKREMSNGEIACALSHKNIYKKIVSNRISSALVLEDDIDFDKKLKKFLECTIELPNKWEIILLGHHTGTSRQIPTNSSIWYEKVIDGQFILRRPCEMGYGSYGYLISYSGAQKLLNYLEQITLPIDHFTGDSKYINLYILQRPIIYINSVLTELSNLSNDRYNIEMKYLNNKNLKVSVKIRILRYMGFYVFLKNLKEFVHNNLKKIYPLRYYK